ncbi:hypothetical protein [Streptomyces lydicus]|uniref:hypothetical protein n=1 Tax=Streptomyces lydicus TaxID=47763 RepID=UPI0037005B46
MEQTTKPVYSEPVVLDAGDVAAVTLGTANFDTADDTQDKNPFVASLDTPSSPWPDYARTCGPSATPLPRQPPSSSRTA